jgi:hypothetical protein
MRKPGCFSEEPGSLQNPFHLPQIGADFWHGTCIMSSAACEGNYATAMQAELLKMEKW